MFKKLNNSTSTEVKYNAVSSIKKYSTRGDPPKVIIPKRGRTLQTQGHQQKTMSVRRSLLILFLIFNINLLVSFSPIDS